MRDACFRLKGPASHLQGRGTVSFMEFGLLRCSDGMSTRRAACAMSQSMLVNVPGDGRRPMHTLAATLGMLID